MSPERVAGEDYSYAADVWWDHYSFPNIVDKSYIELLLPVGGGAGHWDSASQFYALATFLFP